MASPSSVSTMLTANDPSMLIEEANRLTSVEPYLKVAEKVNLVLDVLKISQKCGRDYEDNLVKVGLTYSSDEPHYTLSIIMKEKVGDSMNTHYSSFTGMKFSILNATDLKKMLEELNNI